MDKGVEITDLDAAGLDAAAALLAAYTHPEGSDPDHVAACRANLRRLLAWPGGARVLVARRAGTMVGFAVLHWGFSTTVGRPILLVKDLYTAPAHRRSGVARALLRRAEDVARAGGAHRLQLDTDQDNAAARRLYESEGWEWLPRKEVYMRFL